MPPTITSPIANSLVTMNTVCNLVVPLVLHQLSLDSPVIQTAAINLKKIRLNKTVLSGRASHLSAASGGSHAGKAGHGDNVCGYN